MERGLRAVTIREDIYRELERLANEAERRVSNDLINDVVALGIEEFIAAKKILPKV